MMKQIILPFCLILLGIFCAFAANPSSDFILRTTTLAPYTPGFIGNGHFSLVTTQLGITNAESYMAWIYDHGADDIPRIAVIPAWNAIDIKSGDSWLSSIAPSDSTIRSYSQERWNDRYKIRMGKRIERDRYRFAIICFAIESASCRSEAHGHSALHRANGNHISAP
jgi:hypothetical protein